MSKSKSESKIKFLLYAPEIEGSEELKKEIENSGIGAVERVRSVDLARTQVSSGEVQGIILNLKIFGPNEVRLWISPFDPRTKKMSIGLKFLGSKELVNALYNELKEE